MGSLQAIAEIVNKSAECNYTQLVSREDGSTIITTFDWTDLFAPQMKRINGIKKSTISGSPLLHQALCL